VFRFFEHLKVALSALETIGHVNNPPSIRPSIDSGRLEWEVALQCRSCSLVLYSLKNKKKKGRALPHLYCQGF
jgi:hypothetical protein